MAWLRLEARCGEWGWTGELSPGPFAAWIKLLCTVKGLGLRDGRIKASYFSPRTLRSLRLTSAMWSTMLKVAFGAGALKKKGDFLVITNWSKMQVDPTAKRRQKRHRQGQKRGCHGLSRHVTGSHDLQDTTGQYNTGQDRTNKKGACAAPAAPPVKTAYDKPLPPFLEPYRNRTTAKAIEACLMAMKNRPRLPQGYIRWWFLSRWKPEKGSPLDGLKAADHFATALVDKVNHQGPGRRKPFEDLTHLVQQAGTVEEPLPDRVMVRGESLDVVKLVSDWCTSTGARRARMPQERRS